MSEQQPPPPTSPEPHDANRVDDLDCRLRSADSLAEVKQAVESTKDLGDTGKRSITDFFVFNQGERESTKTLHEHARSIEQAKWNKVKGKFDNKDLHDVRTDPNVLREMRDARLGEKEIDALLVESDESTARIKSIQDPLVRENVQRIIEVRRKEMRERELEKVDPENQKQRQQKIEERKKRTNEEKAAMHPLKLKRSEEDQNGPNLPEDIRSGDPERSKQFKDARNEYRQYRTDMKLARTKYFDAFQAFEQTRKSGIGNRLMARFFSDNRARTSEVVQLRKAMDDAEREYNGLLDQVHTQRDKRIQAHKERFVARQAEKTDVAGERRKAMEDRIIRWHAAVLDKAIDNDVQIIERFRMSKSETGPSNRFFAHTRVVWDWYRKIPAAKKIYYRSLGAGVLGAVTGGVGTAILLAARSGLGAVTGMAAAAGTKAVLDKRADRFEAEETKKRHEFAQAQSWKDGGISKEREARLKVHSVVRKKKRNAYFAAGATAFIAGTGAAGFANDIVGALHTGGAPVPGGGGKPPVGPERAVPKDAVSHVGVDNGVPSVSPHGKHGEMLLAQTEGIWSPEDLGGVTPRRPANLDATIELLKKSHGQYRPNYVAIPDIGVPGGRPSFSVDAGKGPLMQPEVGPKSHHYSGNYAHGSSVERVLQQQIQKDAWATKHGLRPDEVGKVAHLVRRSLEGSGAGKQFADQFGVQKGNWDKVQEGVKFDVTIEEKVLNDALNRVRSRAVVPSEAHVGAPRAAVVAQPETLAVRQPVVEPKPGRLDTPPQRGAPIAEKKQGFIRGVGQIGARPEVRPSAEPTVERSSVHPGVTRVVEQPSGLKYPEHVSTTGVESSVQQGPGGLSHVARLEQFEQFTYSESELEQGYRVYNAAFDGEVSQLSKETPQVRTPDWTGERTRISLMKVLNNPVHFKVSPDWFSTNSAALRSNWGTIEKVPLSQIYDARTGRIEYYFGKHHVVLTGPTNNFAMSLMAQIEHSPQGQAILNGPNRPATIGDLVQRLADGELQRANTIPVEAGPRVRTFPISPEHAQNIEQLLQGLKRVIHEHPEWSSATTSRELAESDGSFLDFLESQENEINKLLDRRSEPHERFSFNGKAWLGDMKPKQLLVEIPKMILNSATTGNPFDSINK